MADAADCDEIRASSLVNAWEKAGGTEDALKGALVLLARPDVGDEAWARASPASAG